MVDVSVLTPVLNEEEHIREVDREDARSALRRDDRVHLHRRRLRGPDRRDPARAAAGRPARAHPRQPAAQHAGRAQHRPRQRARRLHREDGRSHALSGGLPRARGRPPAPWRRRPRQRPPAGARGGHLVAPGRPGARHAARPRRGAVPAGLERRDRGRQRLHRRLAAIRARGARRLGRGLAQRPGLRAGGAHPRGRRAHPVPARDEREVHPARQPQGARPPVLALRRLPRQDLRGPSGEHAPLPPARSEPRALDGRWRSSRSAACAGSGA